MADAGVHFSYVKSFLRSNKENLNLRDIFWTPTGATPLISNPAQSSLVSVAQDVPSEL